MTVLLAIVGIAAIAVGLGLIWFPIGLVAAGVGCLLFSWLLDVEPAK